MVDLAVIMSVYYNDRLEFVVESVESILNQTFTDFHFFIVFDGPVSKDTDDYISSINDKRMRLFRLDKNEGLAHAMNFLLEIVLKDPQYKFIARMDADDISMPARFDRQRTFLLDSTDVTVLGCWYEEIDETGRHMAYKKLPIDHESLRKRYYTRTPFAHGSVMFKRELIEKAGYYPINTTFMEDNVLWGNSLLAGLTFRNIPEYLFKFRKDKDYYERRSGYRYGLSYIKTRCRINRLLKFSCSSYIFTLVVGFIKMLPSFVLRSVNKAVGIF